MCLVLWCLPRIRVELARGGSRRDGGRREGGGRDGGRRGDDDRGGNGRGGGGDRFERGTLSFRDVGCCMACIQ